ncbi:MAG: J domain-containing protein [Acetobacteraceae bacterium]
MSRDPQGFYQVLGIEPTASAQEVVAAFRHHARRLHPDVPVTGNADAFIALKRAYEVIGHPAKRAAYDADALHHLRILQAARTRPPASSLQADSAPHSLRTWWKTLAVAGGISALLFAALIWHIINSVSSAVKPHSVARIRPNAPVVAPAEPETVSKSRRGGGVPHLAGVADHYVAPGLGPAILWEYVADRRQIQPIDEIDPFTGVRVLQPAIVAGMAEVQLTQGRTGLVHASRLVAGDQSVARRAFCAYHAGPPPSHSEILHQTGEGNARIRIRNQAAVSAVVKLRHRHTTTLTMFLAPGQETTAHRLPAGSYAVDYAMGELWSRGCGLFVAGMRAQRLPILSLGAALTVMTVPPDPGAAMAPLDISEEAFARE